MREGDEVMLGGGRPGDGGVSGRRGERSRGGAGGSLCWISFSEVLVGFERFPMLLAAKFGVRARWPVVYVAFVRAWTAWRAWRA